MKRIFIATLWCSLAINAMEQEKTSTQNNDNPLYIGIVTHILREATYEGKLSMVPCEKNMIVYNYIDTKTFAPVADITEKYLTIQAKKLMPTLPDPSPVSYNIAPVKFHDFKSETHDISEMNVDIELDIAKKIYTINSNDVFKERLLPFNLKMGDAIKFDLEKDLSPAFRTVTCEAAFSHENSYLPGFTNEALDELAGKTDLSCGPFHLSPNVSEPCNPSILDTNQRLNCSGPHPASLVMAFLKVKKQNNEYIPVPTERAAIILATRS